MPLLLVLKDFEEQETKYLDLQEKIRQAQEKIDRTRNGRLAAPFTCICTVLVLYCSIFSNIRNRLDSYFSSFYSYDYTRID